MAVVDGVEVHVEDLVFGEDLLHLDGDPSLANLTLDGVVELLLRQDGVAHELLSDGRGALGAAGELAQHGTTDADDVHAVVLVEALVLNLNGALKHVIRDLVDGHALAVLNVERGDLVAVGVENRCGLRGQIGVGVRVIGQVRKPAGDVCHHADAKGDADDDKEPEKRADDNGERMRFCALARLALAWAHKDLLSISAQVAGTVAEHALIHANQNTASGGPRPSCMLEGAIFQNDCIPRGGICKTPRRYKNGAPDP